MFAQAEAQVRVSKVVSKVICLGEGEDELVSQ